MDSSLISYGPCQTPTLGFCVERHDQILTHKPETYYVLQVQVLATNAALNSTQKMNIDWERERCFDKDVAVMFLNLIKTENTARIVSVTKKEKQKEKPIALNTVELMRAASSGLGMGPSHAMSIAERLYTQGYISYPRTESTTYAENFDLKDVLRQQQNHPDWGAECKELLQGGKFAKPRKGHDAGDHPPITPCRAAGRGELDGDAFKLYDYIVRHFIGTVSPNCKYDQTTVKFDIAGKGCKLIFLLKLISRDI